MRELKISVFIGLALMMIMSGKAWAMGLEAAVGVWNQRPDGEFGFRPVTKLDDLSLRSDLDYDDTRRVFGRLKIVTPLVLPNIYLLATPMRFSGTGRHNVAFTFGDIVFNGNIPFSSELKLDHYDLGLYYRIPGLGTASGNLLNLELGIDARAVDLRARITGREEITGLTVTETKKLWLGAPMLYLGIRINPAKWLALEGEGRGVAYQGDHYYDLMGRVKILPVKPVFVAVGYRYEKVDYDGNDLIINARFRGLTAEAGIEF